MSVKAIDSDGCIAESTKSFYISDGGEQETILKGDVNRNGVVDVNDVTHLQIHISNDDKIRLLMLQIRLGLTLPICTATASLIFLTQPHYRFISHNS